MKKYKQHEKKIDKHEYISHLQKYNSLLIYLREQRSLASPTC